MDLSCFFGALNGGLLRAMGAYVVESTFGKVAGVEISYASWMFGAWDCPHARVCCSFD